MRFLTGLSILLVAFAALAADSNQTKNGRSCEDELSKTSNARFFEIIPSDRVPSQAEEYREYVKELTEPGGVIEKLGIRMTGQIVEFVQGRDLNALTSGTAGGYPVSFYLDGAAVLRSLQPRNGFALEVVYPGPNFQHGFYRDDNPKAEQMSIIDHVLGHNSFAYSAGMQAYRAGQGLLATKEIDKILTTLYGSFNKDDVQRFYIWSLTLASLLDWYGVHYQTSEEFEPKLDIKAYDPLGRSKAKIERHPKAPTENILPAFAGNIAPHQPEWKRKILELIHTSMAFRPALVHTQIMNEGWASILQEIVPRHTKNNHNFAFWMKAKNVMQQEGKPKLHDPYSLGVFAWRRLKERFEQRPQIRSLKTQLEKDRAFIEYAQEEIIARLDDEQFLRLACDQVFIDRYKLAIVRRASPQEEDPNLPQPNPPPRQPVAQWRIVSKDAEKVVQAIIDQVIKPKYNYNPRVKLVDFNRPGSGEVELVLNDEVSNELALERTQLAPALYALANIIDKPISLEGMMVVERREREPNDPFARRQRPTLPGPTPAGWDFEDQNEEPVPELSRVRVVVSPTGEVRAYLLSKTQSADGKKTFFNESPDQNLSLELSAYLKSYLQDLYMDDLDERDHILSGSQSMREISAQMIARMIDDTPYDSLLIHAPNVAGAILEFKTMMERRMLKALELASRDSQRIRMVNGQPRIRALPMQVHIQFDSDYMEQVRKRKKGAPVDIHLNRTFKDDGVLASGAVGDYQGEDGRVGEIDGNPGDRFWGPGNPQGGGASGTQPGEDPNDPSWVDIPQDLYSKFLGEKVKLPILNPKPGLSRVTKYKPGKRINRMFGQMLPMEIAENAFKRGLEEAIRDGRDPSEDVDRVFDEGFGLMHPRDFVVKSKTITKKPEVKAAVTFVLDASGSTARYMEAFKRFVHDIETLIRAHYRGFAFEYIIFDTQAHVMKNKEDFFRAQLGGGTTYHTGTDKAKWLFNEKYPRQVWDRYTFLMGDMEDFSPDKAFASIKSLLEDSEFFGTVAGLHSQDFSGFLQLLQMIRAEVGSNPAMGLTILDQDGGYRIDHIREVLRNEEED